MPQPVIAAGAAIAAPLDRAQITGDQVDAVVFGNVVQAGVGPNPARPGAAAGGIPMRMPTVTVNKLCLSGLAAIAQAAAQAAAGYSQIVVAGGTESMTGAPHLLPGSRNGIKYGSVPFADALGRDGLACGFDGISMGAATERYQAGDFVERGRPQLRCSFPSRPPFACAPGKSRPQGGTVHHYFMRP
jgi:acetyl-CoA C-acetyltransferase